MESLNNDLLDVADTHHAHQAYRHEDLVSQINSTILRKSVTASTASDAMPYSYAQQSAASTSSKINTPVRVNHGGASTYSRLHNASASKHQSPAKKQTSSAASVAKGTAAYRPSYPNSYSYQGQNSSQYSPVKKSSNQSQAYGNPSAA